MGKLDERDGPWDALVALLRRVRGVRGLTLDEAQRCFAAAPDEPLSERDIHAMVAQVVDCLVGGGLTGARPWLGRGVAADLVFSADTLVTVGDWAGSAGAGSAGVGLCQWVAFPPWPLHEDLVTEFNSVSVDTRRLRLSRAVADMRLGSVGTDPVVFDVWTGLDELALLPSRGDREADVSWDARLDAADWETLQCAVSSPTWYDFAGYNDEAVEELRRN